MGKPKVNYAEGCSPDEQDAKVEATRKAAEDPVGVHNRAAAKARRQAGLEEVGGAVTDTLGGRGPAAPGARRK